MKSKKAGLINFLCTVAILSILVFILASCNGNDNIVTSQNSASTDSSSSSGEEKSGGVFEGFITEPDDFDLGGITIVMSSHEEIEPEMGKTPDEDKIYKRRKMAEEKYNFKFEYKVIPGMAHAEQFAVISAAGLFFADIVTGFQIPWLNKGFLMPLDEVIDFTSEKYAAQSGITKWIDGKHYQFTKLFGEPQLVLYNPDILERAGAPDPLVLAQEGNWTWDALMDIAEMTTSGLGTANAQYGLRGWFLGALLESNGVRQIRIGDGKFETDLFDNSTLNALNFWRQLFVEKKVVDPADWTVGNNNFINGTNAMIITERWRVVELRKEMTNFKAVPMPFGPDNQEGIIVSPYPIKPVGFSPMSEIPVEQLAALWVYGNANDYKEDSETYIDLFENFYEGNKESNVFDSDESLELFWDVATKSKLVFGPNLESQIIWDNFLSLGSPINLGEPPSTVLETMKNEVYAYLETLSE